MIYRTFKKFIEKKCFVLKGGALFLNHTRAPIGWLVWQDWKMKWVKYYYKFVID